VGPHSDAGSAYLIFDSTQLLGSVPLGRVANGLADEGAGIIYTGASTGDALGFAVAFPGDITGTAGDDLALGAPFADASPVLPDAGIAYVAEGGNLATSTVDVSQLGVGVDGTQFTMDQAGAQLGFALAGGGDSQADGNRDFLMGSPGYTPENLEKSAEALDSAGAVFQTSARLGRGIVDVCRVGSAAADGIDGVTVTGARADDHLGSAVAGVSDVTGDGFDDIVLGAPNADPAGVADAGIAYLLDGASVPDARRGTISASEVGTTQAGIALAGTQVGETAGASLAGPGDLNGGGTSDVAVGAPGRDIALEQDAGTVYIVTRDDQDADGEPDISDCQPANGNVWRTPGDLVLVRAPATRWHIGRDHIYGRRGEPLRPSQPPERQRGFLHPRRDIRDVGGASRGAAGRRSGLVSRPGCQRLRRGFHRRCDGRSENSEHAKLRRRGSLYG
jgi:hypothetical protein